MRIAITGSHSQGKTTLLNDLRTRPEFRKFSFLGNITRGIKELGVEINEGGSDLSQALVIGKHIEHYFTKGNVILDRCALDGAVYTEVLHRTGQVSDAVLAYAVLIFEQLTVVRKYDILFYVYPELPLVEDNTRSTHYRFFTQVCNKFADYILEYKLPVVILRGSREERVNTVINTYNKFNNE